MHDWLLSNKVTVLDIVGGDDQKVKIITLRNWLLQSHYMIQKHERCVEPLPCAYRERYDASLVLLEHLASSRFRHLRHGGMPCILSV
jgi:hypothetical protein